MIRPPRRARSDTQRSGHLSGCTRHPVIAHTAWCAGHSGGRDGHLRGGSLATEYDSPSSSRCSDSSDCSSSA
ncbi:hypothetical protein HispidOSU_016427 [Sigmodon hispidus]